MSSPLPPESKFGTYHHQVAATPLSVVGRLVWAKQLTRLLCLGVYVNYLTIYKKNELEESVERKKTLLFPSGFREKVAQPLQQPMRQKGKSIQPCKSTTLCYGRCFQIEFTIVCKKCSEALESIATGNSVKRAFQLAIDISLQTCDGYSRNSTRYVQLP